MESLTQRVSVLESFQDTHVDAAITLQLHMEMEERSRHNNLRLQGLPEATGPEDLVESAAVIFQKVSGAALLEQVEFDCIHRALGPRPTDPARPRDVICRLHWYTYKETVLHKAWEFGELDFDGAMVKILPAYPGPLYNVGLCSDRSRILPDRWTLTTDGDSLSRPPFVRNCAPSPCAHWEIFLPSSHFWRQTQCQFKSG